MSVIVLFISIGSVEFYVIMLIVAAVILASAIKPSSRGEVQTFLFAGSLECNGRIVEEPVVELIVDDRCRLTIVRHGLRGLVASDGAVSIAMTVLGNDIKIEERITTGKSGVDDSSPDVAVFLADQLSPMQRYHLRYNSESLSLSATTFLSCRPGVKIVKTLHH